ncbi:MAG: hypothetical protein KC912_04550 [Proteobacteria bacterium]|nr:hypothetical protein [Pseudomonadota bacterium]
MIRTATLTALVLIAGCGDKTKPEAAAANPEPAPAAVEVEKPVAEPEPEPEPPEVTKPAAPTPNADFNATLTFGDGRVVEGHVIRVERGEDWYAEKGWTDRDMKLTVTLEGNGTEIEANWADIGTINIGYGTSRSDIDCTYDSAFLPWMYMCVLRTTTKVKTTDGKAWSANGRHKWQFTFDDGQTEEFFIYKLPAREQDNRTPEPGVEMPENAQLYASLQESVLENAKTSLKSITIE